MHCVWSTKGRRNLIPPELQKRLFPYLGGIARDNGMKALVVGGISNHVHSLVSLPSTMAVAKAVQLLKGGSSKWVHDTFPDYREFEWQAGYGAVSIGAAQVDRTIKYIENQEEHHRGRSFEEEFLEILKVHGVEYDARYIWD
jgi:REP element-mobilizing transposase RayT